MKKREKGRFVRGDFLYSSYIDTEHYMASLRAFCEDIHSAVAEANHDWSDASVTTVLDRADDTYLTKIHGFTTIWSIERRS